MPSNHSLVGKSLRSICAPLLLHLHVVCVNGLLYIQPEIVKVEHLQKQFAEALPTHAPLSHVAKNSFVEGSHTAKFVKVFTCESFRPYCVLKSIETKGVLCPATTLW